MLAQWAQDQASTLSSTAQRPIMCSSPGYSQLHAGHWLLIQRRILQGSIEYRLRFDEQLIFVTKGLRICFSYLSRHVDSESPLSSFHGFSIHSKSHISQLGFTHFVRCDSKADISSHAAISNFLRGCYQISEINLPLGCTASGVENQTSIWRLAGGTCLPDMLQHITPNTNWMFGLFLKRPLNP